MCLAKSSFCFNSVNDLKEHVQIHKQAGAISPLMNFERHVPLAANIERVATFTHM